MIGVTQAEAKRWFDDDSDSDDGSDDDSGSASSDESEPEEIPAAQAGMQIQDQTDTNLINLRRTIYLTIMSSMDFEEAGHKLMKIELRPGQEMEIVTMIIECCSQEKTYLRSFPPPHTFPASSRDMCPSLSDTWKHRPRDSEQILLCQEAMCPSRAF